MESEKVKEIKECLEERAKTGSGLLYKENDELKVIYFTDILTLINELESKLKAKEGYYNAVKNMALAVFAERIKGYIHSCENISNSADEDLCERIDETLKELQWEQD